MQESGHRKSNSGYWEHRKSNSGYAWYVAGLTILGSEWEKVQGLCSVCVCVCVCVCVMENRFKRDHCEQLCWCSG